VNRRLWRWSISAAAAPSVAPSAVSGFSNGGAPFFALGRDISRDHVAHPLFGTEGLGHRNGEPRGEAKSQCVPAREQSARGPERGQGKDAPG